mmetsp:Transcript_31630/g.74701  ORF Transcript_31630/g.74701 Transcript_31630/m.74701 type:complete len:246 (-) Transcript_31630:160-897(-)
MPGAERASRLAHPPPLGLFGLFYRLLLLLAAADRRLDDAADDDDARPLDEHGEECAHQRLREAEQPRVLQRRVVLRGHGEECEEQRGDEQEVARRFRDLVTQRTDGSEALDLVRAEGVEGRAALQHRRVVRHHLERLLLTHHVVEHVGAGEHRVAEGVGRVEDLRVIARRLLRQLLRAVDLQHRRPQHLEVLLGVLLLELASELEHGRWQPLAAQLRLGALLNRSHLHTLRGHKCAERRRFLRLS